VFSTFYEGDLQQTALNILSIYLSDLYVGS